MVEQLGCNPPVARSPSDVERNCPADVVFFGKHRA